MTLPVRLPITLALAAGALALPGAASAATDCPLQAPLPAAEHAIPGTNLTARDPYGGRLSRNRLFFDLSVRGPAADLANAAKVTWTMDGVVVREDPTAPFEWKGVSGSSKRMPAGDHTVVVTVTPKAGDPASVTFPPTATDCQNVDFGAEVPKKTGPATLSWASAFESDNGEPLRSVAAIGTANVTATLPGRLRGRKVGTLRVGRKTYTLKGGARLLDKDGIVAASPPAVGPS